MKKTLLLSLLIFCITIFNAQTTTWNGSSWSNGTPDSGKDVIINGNFNLPLNLNVRNFTINPGFVYTISPNFRLTIYGDFTNNGTMIVDNDAVLIQRSNSSLYFGSGTTIVRRKAKLKQKDYNYWSSPVLGQNLYSFSPGTPKAYFFRYNESNDRFVTTGLNDFSNFDVGVGYAIRGKDSYSPTIPIEETFSFSGLPNNGTVTITLKKSSGADKGYNLVGNPYPSNLNFKAVANASVNRNSIFSKQWLWTNLNEVIKQQGSAYAGNNYATYVANVGGVGPTYVSGNIEEVTLRPQENTKVGQGFIVQAKFNNAVLTLGNNMRSTSAGSSIFYNKNEEGDDEEPEEIINRYWIKFINPDNIANNILIAHIAEATDNYDEDYDSALFGIGNDAFYSAIGTNKLQVQARALPIKDSDVIPLGYKNSKAGNCIIALNDKDGVFKDSNKAIYLKDKVTGTVTNLQDGYYTFYSDVLSAPNESRFEIIYDNSVLAADNSSMNQWIVFKKDTNWIVRGSDTINDLQMYDASGKLIRSITGNNSKELKVSNIGLLKGIYIFKLTTSKGVVTKKVLN